LYLLSKEVNAIEHRFRARGGDLEPAAERSVLFLELCDVLPQLRLDRRAVLAFDLLEPCFGNERAPTKAGELVTEVPNQQRELAIGAMLRTIAV
jgi:hypothetical protein